jgi:hypothetical protein
MSNVKPHDVMKDALKIALAALVATAFGIGAIALATRSLSQGYAVVGKYQATIIAQVESPVAFYLAVSGMYALGLVLLAAGAVFLVAKGERRARLVSYLNTKVFAVRRGIRWLLVGVAILLGTLILLAFVRT